MNPKQIKRPAEKTVGRRTVLEWLGGATTLALGGPLLTSILSRESQACSIQSLSAPYEHGEGSNAADYITSGRRYPFEPGNVDDGIFPLGSQRTVDPPDLASILATWRLTVDGMVKSRRVMTFSRILRLPRQNQVTDLHCVEGWSVYDIPWNGIPLWKLARKVRPRPEATHVTFHASGGIYKESLPLSVAFEPRTLLAYGIGESTLPLERGFPLRVVIPRLFGYKNAKHIERIEFTDRPVDGFWESYGYPYEGEVQPHRLRPGKY